MKSDVGPVFRGDTPSGYFVQQPAPATLSASADIALYRHRLDHRLPEREAAFQATLNSMAEAVVVADVHGRTRILNCAAENLTGWLQGEAENQPLSNVIGFTDRQAADCVPLSVLRDAPVPLAGKLLSRHGRETVVEGVAAPLKSEGVTIGAVLTLRDVSARHWENRQLRQAQKLEAAGRLALLVSNDCGSLLAIIRDQAEQLLRQFGEYSPARKAAEEIQQAATAAERIAHRLASFGARQISHPAALSLNGILRRLSKLVESIAGPRIAVHLRVRRGAGKINADPGQIEQVITSLVLHSCRNMPEGGQLLIETTRTRLPVQCPTGPYVLLAITHTGEQPDLENIFEPATTGNDGFALGAVHAIVAEHGGHISAEATAEGGCRFEVFLPRCNEPAALPRAALTAPAVLLIDDRESVRGLLHNLFEARGYNLIEAADAAEAVALSEVHEGALHLLIAGASEADLVEPALRRAHPDVSVLRIVNRPARARDEIQYPFSQRALFERVEEHCRPGSHVT
jgi:two-component system cell cycle sensor histidine kinase/response regulator CckA